MPVEVTIMADKGNKKADLAGPGVSTYPEVEKILPENYESLLTPMETQKAIYAVKRHMEDGLAEALNLQLVQVPLVVTKESDVNDNLDRDGSRTPIDFPCGLGINPRLNAQIVQAATKWKRPALVQYGCKHGEGINTDMRAVRKDYFLDHDHSSYVDQWDWERVMHAEERNLEFLKGVVRKIWKVITSAEEMVQDMYPVLKDPRFPNLPKELTFMHAEEILDMYPDLPRKQRETRVVSEHCPAIFIIGIGYVLKDGYPHEMRAADYDDWVTDTSAETGKETHGLNGDILVWNHLTKRRHELTSMGIRVTKETLKKQLEIAGQLDRLEMPYHQMIMNDEVPLSIGGGIGQGRVQMLLLRKAHFGEVTVTVWPEELKEICRKKNIHVLE
jgi:aspartate--ammonia ligase